MLASQGDRRELCNSIEGQWSCRSTDRSVLLPAALGDAGGQERSAEEGGVVVVGCGGACKMHFWVGTYSYVQFYSRCRPHIFLTSRSLSLSSHPALASLLAAPTCPAQHGMHSDGRGRCHPRHRRWLPATRPRSAGRSIDGREVHDVCMCTNCPNRHRSLAPVIHAADIVVALHRSTTILAKGRATTLVVHRRL